MKSNSKGLLQMVLLLVLAPLASATTWYVNGVSGNDNNNCLSATTACKTIGHAISLAASGDSIIVAAATYTENLTIGVSLKILGSGATTTIIDGGGVGTVVTTRANVILSRMTIRHGFAYIGGGIFNYGVLTVNNSIVAGNNAFASGGFIPMPKGGGIYNRGTMTIKNSTVSGNKAVPLCTFCYSFGGGVANDGTLTITNSTITGNSATNGRGSGGGIYNNAVLAVNNSTITANSARSGGGIVGGHTLTISNSTISGNSATSGGGIEGIATLKNSIVANNTSGGNCGGTMTSKGYNLSSDGTCNFTNTGDLNNTDPMLGSLQNNGGPTQTMALPSGSPAVDAANPSGCTDAGGHLLKTDQRGKPRPDTEDTSGCDIGAYERQGD